MPIERCLEIFKTEESEKRPEDQIFLNDSWHQSFLPDM